MSKSSEDPGDSAFTPNFSNGQSSDMKVSAAPSSGGLLSKSLVHGSESKISSVTPGSSAPTSLLPPSPRGVLETLKYFGQKMSEYWRNKGQHLSPVLASFVARTVSIELKDPFHFEKGLNVEQEKELLKLVEDRLAITDDPLFECLKMQVAFESFFGTEVHSARLRQLQKDTRNQQLLQSIVAYGTNIESNEQVTKLYKAIFQLMLLNVGVEEKRITRSVERETASALDCVFPHSVLQAFHLMSPDDKRRQTIDFVDIVLGIRLFNREIGTGGAGIPDLPFLLTKELDALYEHLEKEAQEVGEWCYLYVDILQLEFDKPGTILAPIQRLQDELTNRRQYLLFVHQLQHEVLEAMDIVKGKIVALSENLDALKSMTGVKNSVQKTVVFPKFMAMATIWRELEVESEKVQVRNSLLTQLKHFKSSFKPHLYSEDLELLQRSQRKPTPASLDFEDFVETVIEGPLGTRKGKEGKSDDSSSDSDEKPVRLVNDTTANFMNLPLEYQGCCVWTLVRRGGLLHPGDPTLGVIRWNKKHYCFASDVAMRDFCQDPERYVSGALETASKQPVLINLLCLHDHFPFTFVSDYFVFSPNEQSAAGDRNAGLRASTLTCEVGVQTPDTYINTDIPDPHYTWNEWDLRRKALQMANILNKETRSTQTKQSSYRRDLEVQTYVKQKNEDGTMPGVGTQTLIEKSTQVERKKRYITGLRGHPHSQMNWTVLRLQDEVTSATNPPLSIPAPYKLIMAENKRQRRKREQQKQMEER